MFRMCSCLDFMVQSGPSTAGLKDLSSCNLTDAIDPQMCSYGRSQLANNTKRQPEAPADVTKLAELQPPPETPNRSLVTSEQPTAQLHAGFHVGGDVFYVGKTRCWDWGDKVAVGSRGMAKGPGECVTDIQVLFEGHSREVSVAAHMLIPSDWAPERLQRKGRPGGA